MSKEKITEAFIKEQQRKEAEAQREQLRIAYNEPSRFKIGGRKINIRPITHACADKLSGYVVRQVSISESPNAPELIAKQRPNNKLQSKAIAIAILNDPRFFGFLGWFKVTFFHWFYWRTIFWSFSSSDVSIVLDHIVTKLGLLFFLENMTLIKGMNTLKKKMTKKEAQLLLAEQESEKKQDS